MSDGGADPADVQGVAEEVVEAEPVPEPYWPKLPEGCPPDEAAPLNGTAYRLVDGSYGDWHPHAMAGVRKHSEVDDCRWHGISIFTDFNDIARTRRRYPAKFSAHGIARFQIVPEWGRAVRTYPNNSHFDWWPSEDFVPPPEVEEVL